MGFHDLAKHGLKGKIKISYILVSKREKNGERGREEKGRGRKKKKRKRKEPRSSKAKLQKGMELLTLSRDPWFCLVNGYLLYPNLGFVRISS